MPTDHHTGTWVTYAEGKATGLFLRRCRLEVVSGPDAGLVRDFEASVIRVGARPGCDLELSDTRVSGVHFEIRLDEEGFRLRDLESTNGTWVAGHRVLEVYLNAGTSIFVGASRLRFDPLDEAVAVPLSERDRFGGLMGRSPRMRELYARLERLAASDATVLISGETGTGKELVAEALHDASPRMNQPFIVLDCGSIPAGLVESELFGHEKGAFTGASGAYAGAFERAHGGTLFLDEIGELALELQPRLLRVLERREVRRVGGARVMELDIRLVAATNRDLGVEVNRGRFREDLYYRLAVARIQVPPLRERLEDIPLLVEHFLSFLPGGRETRISAETLDLMRRHDWPGNVRELRNVVERAVVMAETPLPRPAAAARDPAASSIDIDLDVPFKLAKQRVVDEFDRAYLTALLDRHGGNISAAARAAGLDRMSIHKILNRLGLERPGRE